MENIRWHSPTSVSDHTGARVAWHNHPPLPRHQPNYMAYEAASSPTGKATQRRSVATPTAAQAVPSAPCPYMDHFREQRPANGSPQCWHQKALVPRGAGHVGELDTSKRFPARSASNAQRR